MKVVIAGQTNGGRQVYWGRILLFSLVVALFVALGIAVTAYVTTAKWPWTDAVFWTLVTVAFAGFAGGLLGKARTPPIEELPKLP